MFIDCNEVLISDIRRLGKPSQSRTNHRLIRLKCKGEENRQVLRNAKKLRTSISNHLTKIYINKDFTMKERERREVLEEFKRRKEEGENVVIRHNRVTNVDIREQNQYFRPAF